MIETGELSDRFCQGTSGGTIRGSNASSSSDCTRTLGRARIIILRREERSSLPIHIRSFAWSFITGPLRHVSALAPAPLFLCALAALLPPRREDALAATMSSFTHTPSTLKPAEVAVSMVDTAVLKHKTRLEQTFFKAVRIVSVSPSTFADSPMLRASSSQASCCPLVGYSRRLSRVVLPA